MYIFLYVYSDDTEENMSVTNVTDPNDGRNRRKVKFRSDDMNFSDLDESDTQEDDEDESDIENIASVHDENNDTDSEWSDSEEESNEKKDKTDKSHFYGRSFGKENEIRKKIADELAKLDKINQESNISNWNEQEDYSEGSMEFDEDSDVEDNSENEIDSKIHESNDDDNMSDINDEKQIKSLAYNVSTNDLLEKNEDTTLNWKKNLAYKATNAYYERQNSVTNLWKLVYGKLFLLYSLENKN